MINKKINEFVESLDIKYLNKYSMLCLDEETAPPHSAVSLNHPRKVNCIGSVQILASRPNQK